MRCELDHGVKRHWQEGHFFPGLVHDVGVKTADDRSVGDDENRVLLALQLDDDRLQAADHVLVALASHVAVAQLVLLPLAELLREALLHLLIRQPITLASLDLVEDAPADVLTTVHLLCSLDGALQRAAPHAQLQARPSSVLIHELAELVRKLLTQLGERRVAAKALLHVVLTLAMTDEVDRSGEDVQVAEVEHYSAWHIASDPVRNDLAADLEDLDVPKVVCVALLAERLVRGFVMRNSLTKVCDNILRRSIDVVGRLKLRCQHVRLDHLRIVADDLDEDGLHDQARLLFGDALQDQVPAPTSAVRAVEDGNGASLRPQPRKHVVEDGKSDLLSRTSALLVVRIKELVRVEGTQILAAVVAEVEYPALVAHPVQVATELPADKALATCWQANHYQHQSMLRSVEGRVAGRRRERLVPLALGRFLNDPRHRARCKGTNFRLERSSLSQLLHELLLGSRASTLMRGRAALPDLAHLLDAREQ
mmetsp:Transcript_3263/g.11431  ORF Transcript_3263/g.11431 Transcript_3263/m.11431 type:complete len:481 (-) Transcript_3263:479-1921(-)